MILKHPETREIEYLLLMGFRFRCFPYISSHRFFRTCAAHRDCAGFLPERIFGDPDLLSHPQEVYLDRVVLTHE